MCLTVHVVCKSAFLVTLVVDCTWPVWEVKQNHGFCHWNKKGFYSTLRVCSSVKWVIVLLTIVVNLLHATRFLSCLHVLEIGLFEYNEFWLSLPFCSYELCCWLHGLCLLLSSCDTMTSRKKVLLKVIILGDSGWVSTCNALVIKSGYWHFNLAIKRIIHPKMKIVIIYSPSSCSKPFMSFFLICWAQKKIFWRIWVTKQLTVAIGIHGIFLFS